MQAAETLRGLASAPLNQANLEQLLRTLGEFADACERSATDGDTHRISQELLRNIGFHLDVLAIMQLPMDVDKAVGDRGRSKLLCACYNFFRAFVAGNARNQAKLAEHLDL